MQDLTDQRFIIKCILCIQLYTRNLSNIEGKRLVSLTIKCSIKFRFKLFCCTFLNYLIYFAKRGLQVFVFKHITDSVLCGTWPGPRGHRCGFRYFRKKFIFYVNFTSTKKQGKKLQNLLIRKFEFVAKTEFPKRSYSNTVTKQPWNKTIEWNIITIYILE